MRLILASFWALHGARFTSRASNGALERTAASAVLALPWAML